MNCKPLLLSESNFHPSGEERTPSLGLAHASSDRVLDLGFVLISVFKSKIGAKSHACCLLHDIGQKCSDFRKGKSILYCLSDRVYRGTS